MLLRTALILLSGVLDVLQHAACLAPPSASSARAIADIYMVQFQDLAGQATADAEQDIYLVRCSAAHASLCGLFLKGLRRNASTEKARTGAGSNAITQLAWTTVTLRFRACARAGRDTLQQGLLEAGIGLNCAMQSERSRDTSQLECTLLCVIVRTQHNCVPSHQLPTFGPALLPAQSACMAAGCFCSQRSWLA